MNGAYSVAQQSENEFFFLSRAHSGRTNLLIPYVKFSRALAIFFYFTAGAVCDNVVGVVGGRSATIEQLTESGSGCKESRILVNGGREATIIHCIDTSGHVLVTGRDQHTVVFLVIVRDDAAGDRANDTVDVNIELHRVQRQHHRSGRCHWEGSQ